MLGKRSRAEYRTFKALKKRAFPRRYPTTTQKLVRELIGNQETKYVENYSIGTDMASAVAPINNIAEGSDVNNRIGRKVKGKYIQVDVMINIANYGNTYSPVGWIWHIVQDRQPNGTAATYTTIFDTTTLQQYPFKNLANYAERFNILKTETGFISPTNNANTGLGMCSNNLHVRAYIPFKEIVQFGGTTSSVPTTNAIYLVWSSDETVSGGVQIQYGTRFCYHDV